MFTLLPVKSKRTQIIPLVLMVFISSWAYGQKKYTGYTVPFSGSQTITACAGLVSDHAGFGNYNENSNGWLTIQPENAGKKIQLEFTSFSVEPNNDVLEIYDGPSTSSPLLGSFTTSPGTIFATNNTGVITLRFRSNGSINSSGFMASISCVNNIPQADLIIQSASLSSASVVAGSSVSANVSIKNVGKYLSPSSHTGYYLSKDQIFDKADILLTQSTVAPVATHGTAITNASFTIPASVKAGVYYLVAVADNNNVVSEKAEDNNLFLTPLTVLAPQIDLSIINPAVSDNNLQPGSIITTGFDISNVGNASASVFVGIYLSTDAAFDKTDVPAGGVGPVIVNRNSTLAQSASIHIPKDVLEGSYYLLYFADNNNGIAETNETNNIQAIAVTILPQPADLTIGYLHTPFTGAAPGQSFGITYSVNNQGTSAAAASRTGIYLSSDGDISSDDVLLTAEPTASLNPGETAYSNVNVIIPAGIADGSYYILVKADMDGQIVESVENNNGRFTSITVSAIGTEAMSDLEVEVIFTSLPEVAAGAAVNAYAYVNNIGTAEASASELAYYLSKDVQLDASDIFLASASLNSISNGNTESTLTSVILPAYVTPGQYYIIAKADNASILKEENEDNNTEYTTINILPANLDIAVSDVVLEASSVSVGKRLIASYTLSNHGTAPIFDGRHAIYLSEDQSWDSNDLMLIESFAGDIMMGFPSFMSAGIIVPANVAAGNYHLIFVADNLNELNEADENNNISIVPLTVTNTDVAFREGMTDVSTIKTTSGLSVFPNPTEGMFTVSLNSAEEGSDKANITVFNSVGMLVESRIVSGSSLEASFDLSGFPQGIYTIKFETEGNVMTQKVVVE